jgi:hypothetical protein
MNQDVFGDKGKAGEALRDEGIRKVAGRDPEWQRDAITALMIWQADRREPWAVEEFRAYWSMVLHKPEPHHPNAWGAITKDAEFKRCIANTGIYRKSFHTTARGRRVALYFRYVHPTTVGG